MSDAHQGTAVLSPTASESARPDPGASIRRSLGPHLDQGFRPDIEGLRVERGQLARASSPYEVSWEFVEGAAQDGGGPLHCAIEYRTALFDAATVERMGRHFAALARAVVTDPAVRLDEAAPVAGARADATRKPTRPASCCRAKRSPASACACVGTTTCWSRSPRHASTARS